MLYRIVVIVFLSLVFTLPSPAQILLRAPEASIADFQDYLEVHPHQQSHIRYLIDETLSSSYGEKELYKINGPLLWPDLQKQVEGLRSQGILSKTSWSFLADLLSVYENNWRPEQAQDFDSLRCEAHFFADLELPKNCSLRQVNLDELQSQWPMMESVLIENKEFALRGQAFIPTSDKVHLMLLSNSHKEISFWGSVENLLPSTQGTAEPLIDGGCHQHSLRQASRNLSHGEIFFSKDCQAPLRGPTTKEPTWASSKAYWLIPLAILAVGAGAHHMKDKTLVFTGP